MGIRYYELLNNSPISEYNSDYQQLSRRIDKANIMTRQGYSLWGQLFSDTAIGVIQSQSEQHKHYFCFIRADGTYGCFDNYFNACLGLPLYTPRRRNGMHTEWLPDWPHALPCKHIFSLLNGFCLQAGQNVQKILERWISVTFEEERRPVLKNDYGKFIQNQFELSGGSQSIRNVFEPLLRHDQYTYSLYQASKNVKILDITSNNQEDSIFELHIKVNGESVESLPLKNIICLSCLQREQDQEKLKNWVTCSECLSHVCGSCYKILQKDKGPIQCLSYFNGFRNHLMKAKTFYESKGIEKEKTITSKIYKPAKEIIFEFDNNY